MTYNKVFSKTVWPSGQVITLHVTRQEIEQQFLIQSYSNNAGEMKLEGLTSVGATDIYEKKEQ